MQDAIASWAKQQRAALLWWGVIGLSATAAQVFGPPAPAPSPAQIERKQLRQERISEDKEEIRRRRVQAEHDFCEWLRDWRLTIGIATGGRCD